MQVRIKVVPSVKYPGAVDILQRESGLRFMSIESPVDGHCLAALVNLGFGADAIESLWGGLSAPTDGGAEGQRGCGGPGG